MDKELVPIFSEAIDRIASTRQAARAAGLHPGGAGKTSSTTPES
jgi:hypothetical protein